MSKILTADQIQEALNKSKSLESLQKLVEQILLSVKATEEINVNLTEEVTALHSALAETTKQGDGGSKAILDLNNELAEANETIAQLGQQLSLRENNPTAKVIVEIEKESYQIIGDNFITQKGKLTAKELAKDKELLAEMLKKGSGAIVKLTEL